jgi:hypothetical protein
MSPHTIILGVILTLFATLPASAQTVAPVQVAQTISPASNAAPLSADQRRKIENYIRKKGVTSTILKPLTDALGLTTGDAKLTTKQLPITTGDGASHGYNPLPDGGVFLARVVNDTIFAYRLDRSLNLVAAVIRRGTAAPEPMSQAQALEGMNTELAIWASASTQL